MFAGVLIGLVRVPPDFDPSQLVHQAAANPTPDIDIGSDSDISSPPTPLRRFTVASQFRGTLWTYTFYCY